jgi:protein involved in polysaccharide export with SLBB domain
VAGGLTREVDLTKLEVTRFNVDSVKGLALTERQTYDVGRSGLASVTISPGDVVRLNPVFNDRDAGPVELVGEFKRPGLYAIRRGERLSEVIARAGGLTAQSYPLGAIFTRDSVKKTEREGIDRAARELEASLATAITSPRASSRNLAGAAGAVERLVATLREVEPVGRVVVEADPTVLQVRPDLDLVLEPGDKVFMPKRPNSVTVAGEVLNPGALQFQPGFRPDRYVDMAGGLRQGADESRIFVVLPNGAAQPISISFWNYEPIQIPPGSTIVVPRDPAPFDFLTFAKETTELLSRVALIAASLAVISDN